MAESLAHRWGQIIGDGFEMFVRNILGEVAQRHGSVVAGQEQGCAVQRGDGRQHEGDRSHRGIGPPVVAVLPAAEPPDEQVDSLEKLEILPGVIHGLARLRSRGYLLVMVSNQDHLGSDRYPRSVFDLVQGKLFQILAGEGIEFTAVFICPHGPTDGCACRKPKTGLVEEFLETVLIRKRGVDAFQST